MDNGEMVSVRLRDGTIHHQVYATGGPSEGNWKHRNLRSDIMAYRIHKTEEKSSTEPLIRLEEMKEGMIVRFLRYTENFHRAGGAKP